jgi:hypothetical protein
MSSITQQPDGYTDELVMAARRLEASARNRRAQLAERTGFLRRNRLFMLQVFLCMMVLSLIYWCGYFSSGVLSGVGRG